MKQYFFLLISAIGILSCQKIDGPNPKIESSYLKNESQGYQNESNNKGNSHQNESQVNQNVSTNENTSTQNYSINNQKSQTNASISSIKEFLENPKGFRISELIEEGTNKTSKFRPYLFVFNENGTVTAAQSNKIINGTYLVFIDDNKIELRMNFPNNSILNELSDDWYFNFKNANSIRFEDSGDIVQFQKE
jgi:hypothetical protein